MKLGINEINEGIYIAAINKVSSQLQRDGFIVKTDYPIEANHRIRLDLFAQKGIDKRIYEFKIGKNKIQREQFAFLQNYARNIGARLFIIYLEVPYSKRISFEGIEDFIYKHFLRNTPEELLNLAPKVYVDNVDNIDINDIDVDLDNIIELRGSGTVYVEIEVGSRYDIRRGDGLNEKLKFDFSFRLRLDHLDKKILSSYYKIDTSWYYE